MEDNKFTITLNIVGTTLRPKIIREEEEIYRQAEVEINNVYEKYKERIQDSNTTFRALALQFAVNKLKKARDLEEIVGMLEDINLDLEEFLENE